MKRREFIAALGAAAWSIAAEAQQADRMRRIGLLMPSEESDPEAQMLASAFIHGLADYGWSEGRNVRIDVRWAARNLNRVSIYAKELVNLNPEVIAVSSGQVAGAVQQQTRTIPIIFMAVGDPVAGGLMRSISRPEGNTTGVSSRRPPRKPLGWRCLLDPTTLQVRSKRATSI
jgi:putative ABC transport system substrate-binding protein